MMKKLLENMAVGLVILLTLGVVGLVVKYNMVSDNADVETKYEQEIVESLQSQKTNEEEKTSYLDSLEGYEEVDVKVDPRTEESNVNIAVVKTETKKEGIVQTIGSAVQSVEKKEHYISNLEGYEEDNITVDPKKEDAELNIVADEKGENTQNSAESEEAEQLSVDPLSDIVSDIDSIIDESE
jgi:hypothetical protein